MMPTQHGKKIPGTASSASSKLGSTHENVPLSPEAHTSQNSGLQNISPRLGHGDCSSSWSSSNESRVSNLNKESDKGRNKGTQRFQIGHTDLSDGVFNKDFSDLQVTSDTVQEKNQQRSSADTDEIEPVIDSQELAKSNEFQIQSELKTPQKDEHGSASTTKKSGLLPTPHSQQSVLSSKKRSIRWSDNWSQRKSRIPAAKPSQPPANYDKQSKQKPNTCETANCSEDDEEYEDIDPLKKTEDCIRLEELIYTLTAEFFETAFTILVKRKGLNPKEAFKEEKRFGIHVPAFRDPEGFPSNRPSQYTEEVSKKFVEFIHKNVVEAAIFHVILKDTKERPLTVQRYVFQIVGYFMSNECSHDSDSINKLAEEAKQQYASALLELMNDRDITEIEIPWMSKWNISLGIKKQYILMTKLAGLGHMGPFFDDTNSQHFPWKKRPRISQAKKLGVGVTFPPPGESRAAFFTKYLKEKAAEEAKLAKIRKEIEEFKQKGCVSPVVLDELKLETWQYFTSSDESDDDSQNKRGADSSSRKKKQKDLNSMFPICSFMPAKGLLINIFRVDYPYKVTEELKQYAQKSRKEYLENETKSTKARTPRRHN